MKTRLDYTRFSFRDNMIVFIGDKDAIKDMNNYLLLHLPDNVSMTAMVERMRHKEIYAFIYRTTAKADLLMYYILRRKFRQKTEKLLKKRDFEIAMMCLEEDSLANYLSYSHARIVELVKKSMWGKYILEY